MEHVAHVRDAGGVEAQRLVERRCVLPRVERRTCRAGRGVRVGRRWAVDDRGASSVQGRARLQMAWERTWNMFRMFVTLEVLKLSGWLNANACCRVEWRGMRCSASCRREGVGLRRRKRHARAEGPTQGGQRVERT